MKTVAVLWLFLSVFVAEIRANPICYVPSIANGRLVLRSSGSSLPPGSVIEAGAEVMVQCDKDFTVDSGMAAVHVCGVSGEWFMPTFADCVPNANNEECGASSLHQSRIYGGSYALPGELPWMAKLGISHNSDIRPELCSGFLINKEWLLTAAHCFFGPRRVTSVSVHLGKTNFSLSSEEQGQIRYTSNYCVHPNFKNSNNFNYDVALLRISPPVEFSSTIRPICLMDESQCDQSYSPQATSVEGCSEVSSAGWGLSNGGGSSMLSTSLKKVHLNIYSRSDCQRLNDFDNPVIDSQMCAGRSVDEQDTCQGDSGGPLVCYRHNAFAIGVVSSGPLRCGVANAPAIYTRICSVLPWIKSVTNGHGTCYPSTVRSAVEERLNITNNGNEKPKECTVPNVENGYFIISGNKTAVARSTLPKGVVASLMCEKGFEIGANDTNGSFVCSESGEWLPPTSKFCVSLQQDPTTTMMVSFSTETEMFMSTTGSPEAIQQKQQQLSDAAASDDLELAKELLATGFVLLSFSIILHGKWLVPARFLNVNWHDPKFHDDCEFSISNGTALARATACNRSLEMVTLLVDNGADVNSVEEGFSERPLHFAAAFGNFEVVRLLLSKGSEVDAANNKGSTALILAATRGYAEIVSLLLEKGGNVNSVDKNEGSTALIYASANGHVEVVRILLDEGPDIDAKNNNSWTALMAASCWGQSEVVKMLLEHGANVDVKASTASSEKWWSGYTALMMAAFHNHPDVVGLLTAKGANSDGCTNSNPDFNNLCPQLSSTTATSD